MSFETMRDKINTSLRDFNVFGVPASGARDVVKSELRAALILMLVALQEGGFEEPANWAEDLADIMAQLEAIPGLRDLVDAFANVAEQLGDQQGVVLWDDGWSVAPRSSFKGDAGGNIMAVGLFTQISSLAWPIGEFPEGPPAQIRTVGHHAVGFGEGFYSLTPGWTIGATAYSTQDADGNWWVLAGDQDEVRPFGAIGNGASPAEDQDGVAASVAFSRASSTAVAGAAMSWNQFQRPSVLAPGIYDVGDLTQSAGSIFVSALIPGTVIIRVPAGKYFLTASGNIRNIWMKGIRFVGGKGALKMTNTGNNVGGMMVIEDCYFDNYTECAVANLSNNAPYYKISRSIFMGTIAGGTSAWPWAAIST